ncbi:hypothetical protein ACI75Y_12965 [Capnocytophaga stomatis]|uniref:hypothetical protein n=1 Tax=Capnocytophaga stomatis TaxID=1848904 RepID=UPI001ACCF6A2|nr:hypothetical protein [Capnocytophaga stomatis]GIM50583.1 hypothetical protein CAPN003_20350 [Capnocytophaga stomatis]
MKKFMYVVIIFLSISCNINKRVQLTQEKNDTISVVKIAFYKNTDSSKSGTIYLRKIFHIKNPYFVFSNIKINYWENKEYILSAFPTEYDKKHKEYRQFMNNGVLHQIKINPLSNKQITYNVWKDIDTLDFTDIKQNNLKQYFVLGKHPLVKNGLTGETFEDKNVVIYEEPFSEFKRKNPELLEFLTKGDSIELEVISPVKQKYKFKAEW